MTGTVLILGANGRFGRHAAEAFWNAGWRVKTFDRGKDDLPSAAAGVDLIVNAWNPPYTRWAAEVPTLTSQVIDAASATGATVLIPGNIYGYGRDVGPIITGATPKAARNPMGQIRNKMEASYHEAGIRTIVLRAGDFIDTEPSGNWFEAVITAKTGRGIVVVPGHQDAPHAWAYLPDLARAAVALAERRDMMAPFEEVLFPGFTLSLSDIRDLASAALGRDLRLRRFPWWFVHLAAPFWPMGRRLLEMRHLWTMPHALDGTRFDDVLPRFRGTDPVTAIARSLGVQQDVQPDQTMPRRHLNIAAE